jgi:hypothetical protein
MQLGSFADQGTGFVTISMIIPDFPDELHKSKWLDIMGAA